MTPEAVFDNPASLAAPRRVSVTSFFLTHLGLLHLGGLAVAVPAGRGVGLGVGLLTLNTVPVSRMVSDPASFEGFKEDGVFDVGERVIAVGGGGSLASFLRAGLVAKLYSLKVDDVAGDGFLADLGVLAGHLEGGAQLGLAVQNVGPSLTIGRSQQTPPMLVKASVTASPWSAGRAGLEFHVPLAGGPVRVHGGAEYLLGIFSFRAGYRLPFGALGYDASGGGSGGVGVRAGRLQFDYAGVAFGRLGLSHGASVTYRFGPGREE